jgi:K+-sensing histidine kinase KdpD
VLASAAASLREPASAIGAVASFLATRELGPLSEPQRDGIASIAREAASLERTARDLDDLVRLGRRSVAPEFRAADVGALVERAAIELIPAAARRKQTVSFSAEPGLQHERIDEALLYRAIESVAREVLAGAPEGGRVLVEAGRVNGEIAVGIGADAPAQAGPDAEAATGQPAPDAAQGTGSSFDPNAPGHLIALARAIAAAHMGALHARDLGHGRLAYVLRLPRTTSAPAELQPTDSSADSTPPPVEGEPLSLAS